MLLWFWYCKWQILADNSFATGYKRYEINSVNKVYRRVAYLGRVPCVTRENATFRFTHDYNVGQEVNKKPIF